MPDFVGLVQLGFHGTALAFLILGYRLMRKVLEQDNHGDEVELRLKNVRHFIFVSVVVLILGIGAQFFANYFDSRHQVQVFLSPYRLPQGLPGPRLSTTDDPVIFVDGAGKLTVGRNLPIRLVLDDLVSSIEKLNTEVIFHQERLAETEGGGFDDNAG